MVAVIILVFAFRSSVALGYAYGMAVTGTITITTLLFLYVARKRWHAPMWSVVLGGGALLGVDLMFLAANLTKLLHGAWLPLLVGLAAFTVLTTWRRGHALAVAAREKAAGSLRDFIRGLADQRPGLTRLPGTAVFLNRDLLTTPLAMRANVDRIHELPEFAIVVSAETVPVPRIPDSERVRIEDPGADVEGIMLVSTRFGFMERPDIPAALRLVGSTFTEGPIDLDNATYFLSEIKVLAGPEPVMAQWRKRLFIRISQVTSDAEYYGLPPDRTVTIGARIEI